MCAGYSEYFQTGLEGQIMFLNYGNNENKEWVITPQCETVYIQTPLLDIETCCDDLSLTNGQEYQEFSGRDLVDISISVSDFFTVGFYSDSSVTMDGFILKWSCSAFDPVKLFILQVV